MVKEFSLELHRKEQKGDYDAVALNTLSVLRHKIALRENLFAAEETEDFQAYAEKHPEEYKILLNKEAFRELTEDQQREILFQEVNKRPRPVEAVVHDLDD